MKHMKKLTGVLLALVMALSLVTTAFADETTYSITINNAAEGHTYEAYQIFTGDLHEGVLSNIVWGSSVSNSASLTGNNSAAKVAERLDTNYTPKEGEPAKLSIDDLLELITLDDPARTVNTQSEVEIDGETVKVYVISGLAAGYYLVKDKDGSVTGEGDAYTEYIIKVVENVTTEPKSDVPTVEKKVKDINDSTDDAMTDWQDSADHDIGDSVPFQLKATLANNVSSYTTYKVVFHDTLSKGLTYNNDAKVYIDGKETSGFTVTPTVNADGTTTLTISCDDVKALGAGNSSGITVEYTAKLNENAVIGSAGNPNGVYLEYSNNPNKSEEGDNETGNTPKDTVIVFTYKTIVNKVTKNPAYDPEKDTENTGTDSDGNTKYILLKGAGFTLYKKNASGTYEAVGTELKGDEMTTFTWSGLDDGDYKLVETKTPEGYNTIEDIYFTITAEHDILSDNPALTSLSGKATTGEITFTSNTTDGSLSADVVNKAGATLPETGGIGTTIFYVLGTILVLGAGVLLITKKRMSSEK